MAKICILYFGKNGAGNIFAYQMAKSFLHQGHYVDLYISTLIENLDRFNELEILFEKCTIYRQYTYKNKAEFLINTLKIFNFYNIGKTINKENYDFIYIPMMTIWGSILSYFIDTKRIKTITTIHDVTRHLGEKNRFVDNINNHLIKHSTKVITLSERFIPQIEQIYGIKNENIVWVKHANFNYYKPDSYILKKELTKRILFFGRISKYKGIDVLLDAMKILKTKNSNILLNIVGNGQFDKYELKLIEELKDTVSVTNRWIKDEKIHEFFKDIDLVVVPYIEASQSGVIMTAYTFGKPVIVTDVGALSEQVNENSGIVIEPNNPKLLAETIEYLYKEPDKIIQMGNYCYDLAQTEYSWDVSATEIMKNCL